MVDDTYIPRATAEKLATEYPKGTRHQAKIEIAVPLIANGMAPAAVAAQLRVKFSEASDREIDDVVDWVVKNVPPNPIQRRNGNGYGYNGNGARFYVPPVSTPLGPKTPERNPVEQMQWWLGEYQLSAEQLRSFSPLQIPEDNNEALALAIATLYDETDRLNIVTEYTVNKDGKANPSGPGVTKLKQDWIDSFAFEGVPMSDAGAWLRLNPCAENPSGKNGGYTDADVTSFKYFLIEFDKTPLPLQIAFFSKVKLPVAAVLMSGGKSVHAWIKIGAQDEEQYDARAKQITDLLKPFGSDAANKNPSRLSRLPSAVRKIQASGDGVQRLLYLNPMVAELTDSGLREFEQSLLVPIVEDQPLRALAKEALARYEFMWANKGRLGVPIGIPEMDALSGGLKPGQTTVIAGATGGCKSTMAMHAAMSALSKDYGVLLFSLEMDKEEIFDLMMSNYCEINRNKFNNGDFSRFDFELMAKQIPQMIKLPLFIEDSAMNSPEQIRLRTLQLAAEKRIGLVIVDYIQFVNPGLTKDNREQQVAQISHALRVLARESKLPMIVLSQLNDEGKLRESRVIAHNANTVLLVEVENSNVPGEFDRLKVQVVKGRGIPLGTYYLNFNRQFAKLFADAEQRDAEQQQNFTND